LTHNLKEITILYNLNTGKVQTYKM